MLSHLQSTQEERPEPARIVDLDVELSVMGDLCVQLARLDPAGRSRVLHWHKRRVRDADDELRF